MNRLTLAAVFLTLAAIACSIPVQPLPVSTTTPPPSAVPSLGPTATEANTAVVRQAVVNVRAEPAGAVIGQVEAGQTVTVLAIRGDWVRIAEPEGWIFIGCLSIARGRSCEAK